MGHMTHTEFLASLPEPYVLHGRGPKPRNRPTDKVLVATIRSECALAVTKGALPEGTKVAVRINHYASYTVEIVAWSGAVFVPAYEETLMDPSIKWERDVHRNRTRYSDDRYTDELNAALALVETIAERHNYDHGDSQCDHFDTGYYLSVGAGAVESLAANGIKASADPDHADLLLRAKIAADTLGPKVVSSVCGRGGVDRACKWTLDRLIEMEISAAGRTLVYDKRRRSWIPDGKAPIAKPAPVAVAPGPVIAAHPSSPTCDTVECLACVEETLADVDSTPVPACDTTEIAPPTTTPGLVYNRRVGRMVDPSNPDDVARVRDEIRPPSLANLPKHPRNGHKAFDCGGRCPFHAAALSKAA